MIAAVFGSFDPITLGHMDVIESAAKLSDKLFLVVSNNPKKRTHFSSSDRQTLAKAATESFGNVEVVAYDGLAATFCKDNHVEFIFRGVRNAADVEPENALAYYNFKLAGVSTLYVPPPTPKHIFTSATAVRELLEHGQKVGDLVPNAALTAKMYERGKNA
jgi:pantetheine-phosphate adenylyltransferase